MKKLTGRYAVVQGFFWAIYAPIISYESVYLLYRGFSNTSIGMIAAIGGIIAALVQPVLATYADKPESISLKKILSIMTVMIVALGVIMLLVGSSVLLTGVVYCGCIVLVMIGIPMVNALGVESINQGADLKFGVSRGIGSVSYAAASFIVGRLSDKIGAGVLPATVALLAVIFLGALWQYPFQKVPKKINIDEKSDGGVLYFVKTYRRFSMVLVGCILIFTGHVILNSFLFQIVESKGGNSGDLGGVIALSACMELPIMFLFNWLSKRMKATTMIRIAAAAFVVKALGTLIVSNIAGLYAVQLLQMPAWGLITVTAVYYINSIMKDQDAIKGQAYYMMTFTIGTVVGALLGGTILDIASVNTMLMTGFVLSVPGMLLIWKYV